MDDLSIRRPGYETVIQPTPLPVVEAAAGKLRKGLQNILEIYTLLTPPVNLMNTFIHVFINSNGRPIVVVVLVRSRL